MNSQSFPEFASNAADFAQGRDDLPVFADSDLVLAPV